MKLLCTFLLGVICCNLQAQVVLNNAIIKAKVETTRESSGDSEGMITMAGSDAKLVIFLKDSISKVVNENGFMNTITIIDKQTGNHILLSEGQGEKTGYTTTAADREDQKRRMDSTRKANEQNSGGQMGGPVRINMSTSLNVKNIQYIEETKIINKINCKKAIITTVNNENEETKMTVWYTPDYILPAGLNTGRGMMNFTGLKGLPIAYETVRKMNVMGNELTMTSAFEVTEIKTNAAIEDKEFSVPKGYKVKTYSEWIKDNPEGMPGPVRMFRAG